MRLTIMSFTTFSQNNYNSILTHLMMIGVKTVKKSSGRYAICQGMQGLKLLYVNK